MKLGVLKTSRMALLLAGLACLSFVSGQEPKAPAQESLESRRGRAEKGDAEAQFNLGFMYQFGQGVTPDYAEALRWYRKAADLGNVSAQFSLGSMYDFGEGVPQNYAEAVRWYRSAADQGDVRAQFNLGNMYAQGQGVTPDYADAHMWMSLAASHATGDDQKKIADVRDAVAKKMTSAQIAEAQRRAREWKPTANPPGSGGGPGLGPGEGGVFGSKPYRLVGPTITFKVEPEYTEEARNAKLEGTVTLSIEVNEDGLVQNPRVLRGLGMGLDQKAIEAVMRWGFRPGLKDGTPVKALAQVEVNFRLLNRD